MKKIITSIFIILSVITLSYGQVNTEYFERMGQYTLHQQKYNKAIENFNIVISRKKEPFKAYFFRGIAKYYLGDNQGAIFDFTKTLEIHPFYSRAIFYRGVAYAGILDLNNSLKDLNNAIKLDPYNADFFIGRGAVYLQLNKYDEAIKDLDEAILIDPNKSLAYLNRAIAYKAKKEYLLAIKNCNMAIQKNILYTSAFLMRGLTKYEMGWYKKALDDFNQAIKIDDKDPRHYYYRALTEFQLNNIEGMLRDYKKVISLDPYNALTYYNRAIIFWQMKDYEKAINDFDRVIEINPNNILTYFNRANLKLQIKEYNSAIDDYNKTIQLFPEFVRAYMNRSVAKANIGDKEGAYSDRMYANEILDKHDASLKDGNQSYKWIDSTYFQKIIEFEAEFNNADIAVGTDNDRFRILPKKSFFFSLNKKNTKTTERINAFVSDFNIKYNLDFNLCLTNKRSTISDSLLLLQLAKIDTMTSLPSKEKYLIKGIINHLLHNYSSAISSYTMALVMEPYYYPAYLNRAQAVYDMKEKILDNQQQKKFISLGGSLVNNTKKHQDIDYMPVIEDLSNTIKTTNNFSEVWFNKGNVLNRMRRYTEASIHFSKAIELNKSFGEAYYNRGLTLIFLQDTKQGCSDMSKAGELGIENAYHVIKKYCKE